MHDIDLPTDSPGPSQGPGQQPGTGGEHPAPGRTAASGRAWLGWFAAFLLIGAGWALVTPLNQAPDELSIRAATCYHARGRRPWSSPTISSNTPSIPSR